MRDHAIFEARFGEALASSEQLGDPALARALAIHRNTATKALADALADNFPVVRALCGDEPFAACARSYAISHPATDPRLCVYGDRFATFIPGYRPFGDIPWLTDVAALEWLCVEALFAADATALDGAAILAALDAETALALHPATRFASFEAPAAAIWRAHQADAPPDALATIEWDMLSALVTRPQGQLIVTEIDTVGAAFLAACASGEPLVEAAAFASAAGADITALFSTLIAAGAFA